MTDLEKQDPVETARLTTGEESNDCYTKDELLSKYRGHRIRARIILISRALINTMLEYDQTNSPCPILGFVVWRYRVVSYHRCKGTKM